MFHNPRSSISCLENHVLLHLFEFEILIITTTSTATIVLRFVDHGNDGSMKASERGMLFKGEKDDETTSSSRNQLLLMQL